MYASDSESALIQWAFMRLLVSKLSTPVIMVIVEISYLLPILNSRSVSKTGIKVLTNWTYLMNIDNFLNGYIVSKYYTDVYKRCLEQKPGKELMCVIWSSENSRIASVKVASGQVLRKKKLVIWLNLLFVDFWCICVLMWPIVPSKFHQLQNVIGSLVYLLKNYVRCEWKSTTNCHSSDDATWYLC